MYSSEYIEKYKISDSEYFFSGAYSYASGERALLFNNQRGTSVLLNASLLQQIKEGVISEALQFKLMQRGFIDENAVAGQIEEAKEHISPIYFMIDLTTLCNLSCRYCFRKHDNNEQVIVSVEIFDRILEYIKGYCFANHIGSIVIQPWGGEPLIVWDKIVYIYEYFSQTSINVKIQVETNAVLLTEAIVKEASIKNIEFSVSLDGGAFIHNSQRPLKKGGGSYDDVMRGLALLNKPVGIVAVCTHYTYEHLEEVLSFFQSELQLGRIKLNIVKDNPNIESCALCFQPEEIPVFERKLLETIVEMAENGHPITESNIVSRLHNLLDGRASNFCHSRGCQAGNFFLSFDRFGNITPCDLTDFEDLRFSSVYDDPALLPQRVSVFKSHNAFFKIESDECPVCQWYFFCRGGCPAARKYKKQVRKKDEVECIRNRILYPLLIQLILEKPHLIGMLTNQELTIVE